MFWRDLHAVTGVFAGGEIVFLAVTGMPWSAVWGQQVRKLTTEAGWGRPEAPVGAAAWSHGPSHKPATPAVPWALQEAAIHAHHHGGPGLTYCPEVCPTTLAEMTAALKALGRHADRLNVVFISVDPARDTPEQMKLYLSNFDPRIKGFTGTKEQVEAAAKAYRVYHQKVPIDGGGYTVDPSSAVYLFDRRGVFVEPLAYGVPHDMVVERLKRLVTAR